MTDYQFALETRVEFYLLTICLVIVALLLIWCIALSQLPKARTFESVESILTTGIRQTLAIAFTTLLLAFLMERGWLLAIY